jgi:phosphonopyruvate decarboxylase
MKAEVFVQKIHDLGIHTITGVPDSTLKFLCGYISDAGKDIFENHIVTENEGASIGIAIGEYLSTGNPACVYMQNSGLGNTVNPITSLANMDVYGIPMLMIIGWRGEPGTKDEPQHKFMGKVTIPMLEVLDIPYGVVGAETTEEELRAFLESAKDAFASNRQYALIIKKETFDKREEVIYENGYSLLREYAVERIVKWLQPEDFVVSTTGKISRELYEQSNMISGNHRQVFMTVGGMGYASMIAYQLAKRKADHRVICLDGDGAVLMHMGSLAVIGRHPADNLVHICLNNEAHESVGGMPTGAEGAMYAQIAHGCGYKKAYRVTKEEELELALEQIRASSEMVFLEVCVTIGSRSTLGRPIETAKENKAVFMEYVKGLDRKE